ncbi:ubiquitin-conjugating enzyme/RWD-like protein [Auriculariales sp. MPI-PUGE-AT-0066]|nr:ubiquitin-conjugating enzyme/RWD-like protein [Auriculariales sp. MPI-PUGE-AT-0066]
MRRLGKELADLSSDTHSSIRVEPCEDGDPLHLRGFFKGPLDTPYEGGEYSIDIMIPHDYPFRPPVMKFETKIWHPNVSSTTGAIHFDTLSQAWSPALTIKSALISLQSLLDTPKPTDPPDTDTAHMFLAQPAEFKHTALEWAVKFAGAPKKEIQSKDHVAQDEKLKPAAYHGYNKNLIDRFAAMGFDVDNVVSAFEFDYELEEAYIGDIQARLFGEGLS